MFEKLRDSCEELVRKYKRFRLIQREHLRRNRHKAEDEGIIAARIREEYYTNVINDLEIALGYKVCADYRKKAKPNTIEERLDAIEEE